MSGWVLWAVAAGAFGVGEMLTNGFFLAPFAIGGALAAIVEGAGAGELPAALAFVAVSLLALLVVRPLALAQMRVAPALRSGTAALIGRRAIVLERIANGEGVGCVKIDGEVWTARSYDDHVIEPGTQVDVVEIRGATALVIE